MSSEQLREPNPILTGLRPARAGGRVADPRRLVPANASEEPSISALSPRSLRAPPPRDALRGKRPACIHAVHPFGSGLRIQLRRYHTGHPWPARRRVAAVPRQFPPPPCLTLARRRMPFKACDDELRPCARTCAPEPRDIAACRATRCFRAVPPPAPCRSPAAVSVAPQSRFPANSSESSRRQLRIRANQADRWPDRRLSV